MDEHSGSSPSDTSDLRAARTAKICDWPTKRDAADVTQPIMDDFSGAAFGRTSHDLCDFKCFKMQTNDFISSDDSESASIFPVI